MYAAQEMFKTANKVTRPEKALILGFMAGSRGTGTRSTRCTFTPLSPFTLFVVIGHTNMHIQLQEPKVHL